MRPDLAIANKADGPWGNLQVRRERSAGHCGRANEDHVGLGQLCIPLLLAARRVLAAQANAIRSVLFRRSPSKVSRVDASRIAAITVKGVPVRHGGARLAIEDQGDVRRDMLPPVDVECAVSIARRPANPGPALIRTMPLNLLPVVTNGLLAKTNLVAHALVSLVAVESSRYGESGRCATPSGLR